MNKCEFPSYKKRRGNTELETVHPDLFDEIRGLSGCMLSFALFAAGPSKIFYQLQV